MIDSLFIDIQHAESRSLIALSFIFNGEDHDFVAWEAVTLLLGNFENQGD